MAVYKIYKETALPVTREPNSVYFVAPAANPPALEIYVTSTDGSTERHTITRSEVQAMIDAAAIGNGPNAPALVVSDLATRDALQASEGLIVLVADATDDPSVTSGGATYVYTTEWVKISETESLDLVLSWNNLLNRPNSTPTAIDAAVANSHTHANRTQLDRISQDAEGNLTYNGSLPVIAWDSTGW